MRALKTISKKFGSLFFLYILLSSPTMATKLVFSCPDAPITFEVELAQTPEDRAKGLMNREVLTEDEGMLFLFPESHVATMWMKNTPLSLDMIFMDKAGKILVIEEKTTPYSLKIIGPVENTAKVLELLGGTVKKRGISKECVLKPIL